VGWGTGALSPARLRVVCRAGVEETFAEAADLGQEAVGGPGRAARGVGARTERRGGRSGHAGGRRPGAARPGCMGRGGAESAARPPSGVLAVGGAGALAVGGAGALAVGGAGALACRDVPGHRDAGGHEMKVVPVAPRGPARRQDTARGRRHLAWGPASYGGGASAAGFWDRADGAAGRRGGGAAGPGHAGGADGGRLGRGRRLDLATGERVPGRRRR